MRVTSGAGVSVLYFTLLDTSLRPRSNSESPVFWGMKQMHSLLVATGLS